MRSLRAGWAGEGFLAGPPARTALESDLPPGLPDVPPGLPAPLPDAAAGSLPEAPSGAPVAQTPGRPRAGWAWVRVVAGAVVAAVALRVFAFEAFRIPTPSMENTLLVGDFVFVEKWTYGPLVWGRRLPGAGRPERGDVAVFHYPPGREARVESRAPYVKRVAGAPGDTVWVTAKALVVNGALVAAPPEGRQLWEVQTTGPPPSPAAFAAAGLAATAQRLGRGVYAVDAPMAAGPALRRVAGVERVAP